MNIPKDKCTWNEKTRCFVIEASDVDIRPGVVHQKITLVGETNTPFRYSKINMRDGEVVGWRYVQDPPYAGAPVNLLIIND